MAKRTEKPERKSKGAGADGRFELGERTIDDPLEPGRRYKAEANVRESAIDHMYSRGRLNRAQADAGDRFRKLFERAAIGNSRAIDPAKEFVDGGSIGDPLSDDLISATKDLEKAMQAAGLTGSRVLRMIVETGSIEKAASQYAKMGGIVSGRRAEGYITGTLVDALDSLVALWRMEGKGIPKISEGSYRRYDPQSPEESRVVTVRDDIVASGPVTVTGPSFEIHVGRFGDADRHKVRPREHVVIPQKTSSPGRRR